MNIRFYINAETEISLNQLLNIRTKENDIILCSSQEELDYLSGLFLVYGKSIDIHVHISQIFYIHDYIHLRIGSDGTPSKLIFTTFQV